MDFSQREESRDGRVVDLLANETTGLRIGVSRLGAELISLARRDASGEWIGFLFRDNDLAKPASGWVNHATVMGYFLHRLKDGRSVYRGKEIESGNHGFLREKEWHLCPAEEGRLTYEITRADFTAAEYPLDVSVRLSYVIDGDALRVTFVFTNHETELSAHLGFGLHPGFGARSFESFEFRMPAGLYRRHLTRENFLSGEVEEIRFGGGPMPFARESLSGSYILELADLHDSTFIFLDPESGRAVELEMSDVPYLTLWSDGGPFLCVEPCWGLTDHFEQRAFEAKEGIQQIAPGGQLRATFTVSPRLTS